MRTTHPIMLTHQHCEETLLGIFVMQTFADKSQRESSRISQLQKYTFRHQRHTKRGRIKTGSHTIKSVMYDGFT
jgi:hypothetical protein